MEARKELDRIDAKYKNKDTLDAHAGLNLTLHDKLSGSRGHMFISHLEQMLMIKDPETPRVFTGVEKAYGKYSDSFKKSDSMYTVVDIIHKYNNTPNFPGSTVYILHNDITGVYDVIETNNYESLAETHGYIKSSPIGERYRGMKIFPNELLYKSDNHDENMNYRYGKNVNVAYIALAETEEDGIFASEEFCNNTYYWDIMEHEILCNNNDILLNIYGNEMDYQSFPKIGEMVKNRQLCVKRKFNYKRSSELTNRALRSVQNTDETTTSESGTVIDIDIYINDKNTLTSDNCRSQLLTNYIIHETFYGSIVQILGPIVNNKKNRTTLNLRNIYHRALNYLDPNIKYSTNKNGAFEFAYIKLVVCKIKNLTKGSKITDRYGGKGVIVKILPRYMMPKDRFGNTADIILSPSGVVNRANTGQLYEHELNFISDRILDIIKKETSIPKKIKILLDYIGKINPYQSSELRKYIKNLNKIDKDEFLEDLYKNGIFIHQKPNDSIDINSLARLYKDYKIRPYPVVSKRKIITGEVIDMESKTNIIIAKKYLIILKQVPESKLCVRSIGAVNILGIPSKKSRSERIGIFSDTPVRFGDMETMNSMIRVHPDYVARFIASSGNNPELAKKISVMLLEEDPLIYHNVNHPLGVSDSISSRQLLAYLNSVGYKIEAD